MHFRKKKDKKQPPDLRGYPTAEERFAEAARKRRTKLMPKKKEK